VVEEVKERLEESLKLCVTGSVEAEDQLGHTLEQAEDLMMGDHPDAGVRGIVERARIMWNVIKTCKTAVEEALAQNPFDPGRATHAITTCGELGYNMNNPNVVKLKERKANCEVIIAKARKVWSKCDFDEVMQCIEDAREDNIGGDDIEFLNVLVFGEHKDQAPEEKRFLQVCYFLYLIIFVYFTS